MASVSLDALVVYNISINAVELSAMCMWMAFFLFNARKKEVGRAIRGRLSLLVAINCLILAASRLSYIVYDYVYPIFSLRIYGGVLSSLGYIFNILVIYAIIKPGFPKIKTYLAITIPPMAVAILIYYLTVASGSGNLDALFFAMLLLALISLPPTYIFMRTLYLAGINIRRQIIAVLGGMACILIGTNITPLHNYVAVLAWGVKGFGHTIVVIGVLVMLWGFWNMPVIAELEWRDKVRHVYIMMKSGICIYDCGFKKQAEVDSNLVAGGITGITSLVQEMTSSPGKLEVIKQKGANILLHSGNFINVALIATEDLSIYHLKLSALVNEFETLFQHILPNWAGNVGIFAPVDIIVQRTFQ